jgi:hypothetical protein
MTSFDDQLWSDLVRAHGDRIRASAPHTMALATSLSGDRAPRGGRALRAAILSGTALATAGATTAAVLALTATSTPPAFAVTDNNDGTITVTLREISAVSGLNAEFTRRGLNARAVPFSATCPVKGYANALPAGTTLDNSFTITIDPRMIPDGYTAVVAATQTASGTVELTQGAVPSPAPSCFSTEVPTRIPLTGPIPPAIKAEIRKIQREMAVKRAAEGRQGAVRH